MSIFSDLFKNQEKLNEALLDATRKGDALEVQEVLKKGADVGAKNKYNSTALICASWNGYQEIVQILINAGADMDVKDNSDNTALMSATNKNYKKIAKMLIKASVDMDIKDNRNNTALIFAARNNSKEIAEMLIKAGADLNAKNSNGTALIFASRHGYQEIAEMLIKSGADVNTRDEQGQIALDCLNQEKYPATAALLKDAMENPEKYKPISKEEIAIQIKAMSVQEIRDLPKYNPKILGQLCIVSGLMETTFSQLDYSQQKALYAGTYKDVSSVVRASMEKALKNQNGK